MDSQDILKISELDDNMDNLKLKCQSVLDKNKELNEALDKLNSQYQSELNKNKELSK